MLDTNSILKSGIRIAHLFRLPFEKRRETGAFEQLKPRAIHLQG